MKAWSIRKWLKWEKHPTPRLVGVSDKAPICVTAGFVIETILFRMAQRGLKFKDLEPMIGQRNRVYEVLHRTRKLTLAMVWRLHTGLGIAAESLIRPPG